MREIFTDSHSKQICQRYVLVSIFTLYHLQSCLTPKYPNGNPHPLHPPAFAMSLPWLVAVLAFLVAGIVAALLTALRPHLLLLLRPKG